MPTFVRNDLMTAGVQQFIKDAVSGITGDTHAGAVNIVYRRRSISGGSATYDPIRGTITDPYTNYSITALYGCVKDEDGKQLGVQLESTDVKFIVDLADLSNSLPSAGDSVVYGQIVYETLYVRQQVATNLVVLYCRITGGRV